MQQFKIPFRAVLEVTLTLLLLLSLIAINAVIVSAGAAKASVPAFMMMRFDQHWKQLSAMATGMCAIALSFGVILFLGEMSKPANLARWKRLFISIVGWIGFSVTALTILASAALMSTITRFQWVAHLLKRMNSGSVQGVSTLFLLAAACLVLAALVSRASKRSSGTELRGDPFLVFLFVLSFALHLAVIPALALVARSELTLPAYLPAIVHWAACLLANPLWVWPALIVLAKLVRDLLIQFPGDVAIYVAQTSNGAVVASAPAPGSPSFISHSAGPVRSAGPAVAVVDANGNGILDAGDSISIKGLSSADGYALWVASNAGSALAHTDL